MFLIKKIHHGWSMTNYLYPMNKEGKFEENSTPTREIRIEDMKND
jgi:hypothetical protein